MAHLIRLACLLAVLGSSATALRAQGVDDEARRPRFLVASAAHTAPVRATPAQVPALRRRLTLSLEGATLSEALATIARKANLRFMYSDAVIPERRTVHLKAESITLAAALTEVLLDTDVDVVFEKGERAMLVRRGSPDLAVQAGTVVGLVTDAKTGLGVAGAEVFLEHTKWQATADTGGHFHLDAVEAGTYTLQVRRLGYVKQSRQVTVRDNATDTVNVALDPAPNRLNDLVSTATGQQRRRDLANDVTTINADSIVRTQPISSLTDLLENRVPGLTVQRTSGAPGDPARLRLRGSGSPLRSNDPIVVVDGIRVYSAQSAGRSSNLATTIYPSDTNNTFNFAAPSPLDNIDPNTIEKVEVLKGPSAATLYGPDAANGVIVITTKKGQVGPPRWTLSADHGTSRIPGQFPDLLLRWGHAQYGDNTPLQCSRANTYSNFGSGALCTADSTVAYQLLSDPSLTVLDHGSTNHASMGVSGGTQTLTYRVTGTYQKETGLFKLPTNEIDRYGELRGGAAPPNWMQRPQEYTLWGVSTALQAHLGSKAEVSLSADFTRSDQQRSTLERQLGALVTTFYDKASGRYYQPQPLGNAITENTNAILTNYYERVTASSLKFTNGLNFTWHVQPWFQVTSRAGLDVIHRNDELFLPRGAALGSEYIGGAAFDSAGSLNNGHGSSVEGTVDVDGLATIPIGLGLRLGLGAGIKYRGESINDLTVTSRYLPIGTSLIGDTIGSVVRRIQGDPTFGWYIQQTLTHNKFALNTGLMLNSGKLSSAAGGALPKLGFTYMLSDEPFFPFKDLFQSFLLRTSYGRASRQPNVTDRLRLYTQGSPQQVDGQSIVVEGLQYLGNTQVRPERTSEFEGGFEADLIDSRVGMSFSFYRQTTDDALLSLPLPPSVYGYGQQIIKNIGVVRNSGIEAHLTTQWIRTGSLNLSTDLNVSRNTNVVVKLGPGIEPFYIQGGGNVDTRVAPGYPLFSRWTRPILAYADANGDGTLEQSEVVLGDTAVYVGESAPTNQVNLSTNLTLFHGAVALTAGLHYDNGFSQINELTRSFAPFSAAWNDTTSTLAQQAAQLNLANSAYNWVEHVHSVRLQTVTVGYNVPQTLARRMGAQSLSISLLADNVGLWTNYSGLDPNVNGYSTGSQTSDNGVLPQPRKWEVRINATY